MNFRKPLAALALAGALAVGYAGVAGAQTPAPAAPSTPTTQSQHHFTCEGAKDRLAKLQKRDDEIKDHIAKSLRIDEDDFDYAPFNTIGGLGRVHDLFGDRLLVILDELNRRLAA